MEIYDFVVNYSDESDDWYDYDPKSDSPWRKKDTGITNSEVRAFLKEIANEYDERNELSI